MIEKMKKAWNPFKSQAKFWVLSLLFLMEVPLFFSVNAQAAKSKLVKLNPSRIYQPCDITKDGKKDEFLVLTESEELHLLINDEVYSWNWRDYPEVFPIYDEVFTYKTEVHLYQLQNGKIFIGISATGDYDTNGFHMLYRYQSGELIPVLNVNKLFVGDLAGMGHTAKPLKIQKNTIVMKYNTGITSSAIYEFQVKYKPSGNKLKSTDNTYKITKVTQAYNKKKLKAAKSFKVYKKAGGKKAAFTAKAGDLLKPLRVCTKGKKSYLLLENSRKQKGWVNSRFSYNTLDNYA